MMKIVRSIRKAEKCFDKRIEYLVFRYPQAAFGIILIGMPVVLLMLLFITVTVLTLPMAWLLG